MKAKMLKKPTEAGKYFCFRCSCTIDFRTGELACPLCSERSHLVVVYMEDNPMEEMFYTSADWHGG